MKLHFCEPPKGTGDYPTSCSTKRGTRVCPKTPTPKHAARGVGHVSEVSRISVEWAQNCHKTEKALILTPEAPKT